MFRSSTMQYACHTLCQGTAEFRGRHVPRDSVDGRLAVVEVEWGRRPGQLHIDVVEHAQRRDVAPEACEDASVHVVARLQRRRDDVAAKVIALRVVP
eukprot:scaffold704_cov347-Prasinococcus_capsulatus_cf.AAC.4